MGEKLIKALLDPNPNLRIKAKNALSHPWVTRRMYDPLPLNFFESLTYVNIAKKMKLAMIFAIFGNYLRRNGPEAQRDKFFITERYIKKIKEENRIKNEGFKHQRERSFEVVQRKNSMQESNTQSLLICPLKARLMKSKTQSNTIMSNSNSNKEENKENTTVNSVIHHKQQSAKKTQNITSVNSLTNRLSRKNSYSKIISLSNKKKIQSTSLNRTYIVNQTANKNESQSPSRLRVVLPKISRDPFIGATSFPQSLRENINHQIDNSLSPSRNYQLQTPVKIRSKIKNELKMKKNNNNSNNKGNDLNITKLLKPTEGYTPIQSQIKVNQISLKNMNLRPLYLPNINSASPKKKKKVI